ncbi:MAG: hypothetical protein WCK58_13920 [Chloroflexota bacterium]
MQSTIVTKAEKAHRYAQEPDRLRISVIEATFEAGGGSHVLRLDGDRWTCDCEFAVAHGVCPHSEAASRMLDVHLVEAAKPRVVDLLAGA